MNNEKLNTAIFSDLVHDVLRASDPHCIPAILEKGPNREPDAEIRLEVRKAIKLGHYILIRHDAPGDWLNMYPALSAWCEREQEVGAWY